MESLGGSCMCVPGSLVSPDLPKVKRERSEKWTCAERYYVLTTSIFWNRYHLHLHSRNLRTRKHKWLPKVHIRGVRLHLTRLSTHTCLTPECTLVLLVLPSGQLGMKTKQISKSDARFILCVCVYMHTKSLQSCPTLCDPMYCSPPGSSVHGILQARILKWVAIPFSTGSSWPMDWTRVSCIAGRFFTIWATKEAALLVSDFQIFFTTTPTKKHILHLDSVYTHTHAHTRTYVYVYIYIQK